MQARFCGNSGHRHRTVFTRHGVGISASCQPIRIAVFSNERQSSIAPLGRVLIAGGWSPWARSGRTGPCSPTTAPSSRMSEHRAGPLKALQFLCFGKGCLGSGVLACPAAPPQVRCEPVSRNAALGANGCLSIETGFPAVKHFAPNANCFKQYMHSLLVLYRTI